MKKRKITFGWIKQSGIEKAGKWFRNDGSREIIFSIYACKENVQPLPKEKVVKVRITIEEI